MTKADAWMPLWVGEYLADTPHLSYAQHGAYLLLIMAYWRARTPLPDDDRHLASIVKASSREWKALRPVLARLFQVGEGLWRHKRIDREMAKATGNVAARSAAGKASAAKRALQRKLEQSGNKGSTHVEALLQQNGRTSTSPPPFDEREEGAHACTEAVGLAIELRRRGVDITPANPYLLGWLDEGRTPRQIFAALEMARLSKPEPAPIPAKYLDAVLHTPRTRGPRPQHASTRHRSISDERAQTLAGLTGAGGTPAPARHAAGSRAPGTYPATPVTLDHA